MKFFEVIEPVDDTFIRHRTLTKEKTLCEMTIEKNWLFDFSGNVPPTICKKGCFKQQFATFSAKSVDIVSEPAKGVII